MTVDRRTKGRALLLSFALGPALFLLRAPSPVPSSEPWTVFLVGDADGRLAPCGCTSPQEGGMVRRAAALRHGGEHHLTLENGGLGGPPGEQARMKAETAAEALALSQIDAANFTARDAALGQNEALQLARFADGRLVSTSLQPSATVPVPAWREAGPFLVGGATDQPAAMGQNLLEKTMPPVEAAHRLAQAAATQGLLPILLFDGSREAARALARAEPALRLVTYRATGRPPTTLETEGACALATPGERGKGVLRLAWTGDGFASSVYQPLGPMVQDDPEAKKLYARYLGRVSGSDLLEKSPHVSKTEFKRYAGTGNCLSCHAEAAKVWGRSAHAHALKTLEEVSHDRDPDCVRCHVVSKGEPLVYVSRRATPQLANVGCESCHGGGAAHAKTPRLVHLPKVGSKPCLPCHDPENSPRFSFETYWPRIRHR